MEAWKWRPVIRSLYSTYADSGAEPLRPPPEPPVGIDADTEALLERVWQVYGRLSASRMSAMTHAKGTPWADAYEASAEPVRVIQNSSIMDHYRKLAEKP